MWSRRRTAIFFVADGHSGTEPYNVPSDYITRIVKFSKDGKFIKEWGKLGTGPGEFRNAHALAIDSRGRLFVCDRGNARLQIFDLNGKFLAEWPQFGRPSGLYIDKNDKLYVIDADSTAANHPGWKKGIRIGSAKDGARSRHSSQGIRLTTRTEQQVRASSPILRAICTPRKTRCAESRSTRNVSASAPALAGGSWF